MGLGITWAKPSKGTIERTLWTGAEALVGLAITYLGSISAWWAAPIALGLAAVKSHVLDKYAQKTSQEASPTPTTTEAPDGSGTL